LAMQRVWPGEVACVRKGRGQRILEPLDGSRGWLILTRRVKSASPARGTAD